MLAVREFIAKSSSKENIMEKLKKKGLKISQKQFEQAKQRVHRSSQADLNKYKGIADNFKEGKLSFM